jgi:hypothetical protein
MPLAMVHHALRLPLLLLVALLCAAPAAAQSAATLRGTAQDASGAPLAGAAVELSNPRTGYLATALTDEQGRFVFFNVPLHQYVLRVSKEGFAAEERLLPLSAGAPREIAVTLPVAAVTEEVNVAAFGGEALLDPAATGTRTELDRRRIERMAVPLDGRGVEAVLLSFPGFAKNANGAIHPRGAHNQMTYVVDGMPISDQLTGSFAGSLDLGMVQALELYTGNIPAEFGSKISGVASILTRSGAGTERAFTGSLELAAAQASTFSQVVQAGGERGRLAYFGSMRNLTSKRFLDPVSLHDLHNAGDSQRGFIRLDYQAGAADTLRVNFMAGRSAFQVANLRSQHAAGQRQRQHLDDSAVWGGWTRTLSPRAVLDFTASWRTSSAQLLPSAGDTPVTAAQDRRLTTVTAGGRFTRSAGRSTFRAGADYQRFPVRERFSFAITDPAFNDPASPDFLATLLPFDLSRGGALFQFADAQAGTLVSLFAEERLALGRFALTLGLRHDEYSFLVRARQTQPRLGVSFYLRETGTVLRASYNRTFQTPPNENLLLASSQAAAVLVPDSVRNALGNAVVHIRPERENVYEAGVQQALGGHASLDLSYYHRDKNDIQDNDNFFNTGIIFPTTLSKARVNGAEARLNLVSVRGFSGSLSLTHFHAVVTPPFTGGLFLGNTAVDALSAGPFVIDHDQKLGAQATLHYAFRRGLWVSSTVRYDSGLVSNPSDPAAVAADPDYADLLPYVDLLADPPRVRPRTIADLAVGYEHRRGDRTAWELRFQVSNLTDRTALYNFQSIFVGTRLVAPRTAGVRWRVFW